MKNTSDLFVKKHFYPEDIDYQLDLARRNFSTNIKRIRLNAGLSQYGIAKRLGISRVAYCNYEIAFYIPNAVRLPMLSKILNCTIDDLFADVNNIK